MIPKTKKEKDQTRRRIERAIDKMVSLQDAGYGCDNVARILELLNDLYRRYEL
jgi:hypothetical protein